MEKYISYDLLIVEINKLTEKYKSEHDDYIKTGQGYGEMMAFGKGSGLRDLEISLISIPKITITTGDESEEDEAV
jgi:hypothetical protein